MSLHPKKKFDKLSENFEERFQEKIIRLAYQDEGFAGAALERLEPNQFDSRVHSWVWKVMRTSWRANNHHITPTILQNERRKAERLGLIPLEHKKAFRKFCKYKLVKPIPDRTYIKRELNDFIRHSAIKQATLRNVEEHLPKRDYDAIHKSWLDAIDIDVTGDVSLGTRPGRSYRKRIKQRAKILTDGVTTGITEVDRLMIRGGMAPKQLGLIIAPTGRGKTNFLINLAASAVMDGIPTVYYSLELDEDTINTRFDARFTGVPLKMLRSNSHAVLKAWKKIGAKVADLLIVKEFPTGEASIATIEQHLRMLERAAFYPKLVVLDYADLMKSVAKYHDRWEEQGEIYKQLRGLMVRRKVTGWSATQGNRAAMDPENNGDVSMFHTAGAIDKCMIADFVGGISQSVKEMKTYRGRLSMLKNRNGPADRDIKVRIEHDIVRFQGVT